ncbi:hypothetical protein CO641_09240 [Lysobacteraceae bacterium NML91-0213]|nr:hypothetical protein CO641_09240 [Xanthomonadaceae bacterium NML91-0213]
MIRTLLAILAGLVVAIALMLAIEALAASLFPLPLDARIAGEEDLARLVAQAPPGKLALVLLGWCLAALTGGWVAARLSVARTGMAALAVGALIVGGVILNVMALPHPAWVIAGGLLLPVPLAWAGGLLARRPRAARPRHR